MRYSSRIFTFALSVILFSLFWMGVPTLAKSGSTKYAAATQVATNEVPAQESPTSVDLARADTQEPTRAPRPTPTPLALPPPSNPNTIQLMVIFGVLVVLVVIFGLLLNRNRVF